jgi:CRISPR/Cas system-associated endoribonuclease Cas2
MQVRQDAHESRQISIQAQEMRQQTFDEGKKRFFKIFQESTFEGSRAAAQKMKKYAKRQTKQNQKNLFFHTS